MRDTTWNNIKKVISERLKVDPKILDLIAVDDLCSACANGLSNQAIALKYCFDVGYVVAALIKYLNTYGWSKTLDTSPYASYKKVNGNNSAFIATILDNDPLLDISSANAAYRICKEYEKIEEQINEYYRLESA